MALDRITAGDAYGLCHTLWLCSPSSHGAIEQAALQHISALLWRQPLPPGTTPMPRVVATLESADADDAPMRRLHLTRRELDVVRLLAAAQTNQAIGQQLHITERTVSYHVQNICRKLGVKGRSAAIAYALRAGLGGERSW